MRPSTQSEGHRGWIYSIKLASSVVTDKNKHQSWSPRSRLVLAANSVFSPYSRISSAEVHAENAGHAFNVHFSHHSSPGLLRA